MRFIVSNKKYEKALEEIKKLKEAKDLKEIDLCVLDAKKCDLERKIDSKDTEINYLNKKINKLEDKLIEKDRELLLQINVTNTFKYSKDNYKQRNKYLEKEIEELRDQLFRKNEIIDGLLMDVDYYISKSRDLEKSMNNIEKRYRDDEIELLLAIKKRCKKARVKTKYKNKILKIAEKKLLEIER